MPANSTPAIFTIAYNCLGKVDCIGLLGFAGKSLALLMREGWLRSSTAISFLEVGAALIFGLCFNASLLRDADTWWLLGLGRWICDHRGLPLTDPFSYTMAFQVGRQYLPHQWLSALAFYSVYHLGAIQSLLMMIVGVLFASFVALPLRALKRTMPFWFALALTALGVFAAKFHFLARPEIFSYLFEGLMLTCLTEHRLKVLKPIATENKLDAGFIAAVVVIFVLWCNFHSGFIFGAVVLTTYSCATFLIGCLKKSRQLFDWSAIFTTALLPLLALINPFGARLLIYLKDQLWFDPFLNTIGEMTPISLSNLVFVPFFVLIVVFGVLLLVSLRKTLASGQSAFLLLSSLLIVVLPILVAFQHRRFILFAVLVILFESAVLMSQLRGEVIEREADAKLIGLRRFSFLPSLLLPILVSMISVPIAFAWFGCDNRWDLHALSVVDKGVDFVRDNAHDRRIFNDVLLGDRMIWLTPEHPLVFLDTRYDMYGGKLVDEYDIVSMGQPGWQKVLDKYNVELVCFFVKSGIANVLRAEPAWRTVYSDSRTIVFERVLNRQIEKNMGNH